MRGVTRYAGILTISWKLFLVHLKVPASMLNQLACSHKTHLSGMLRILGCASPLVSTDCQPSTPIESQPSCQQKLSTKPPYTRVTGPFLIMIGFCTWLGSFRMGAPANEQLPQLRACLLFQTAINRLTHLKEGILIQQCLDTLPGSQLQGELYASVYSLYNILTNLVQLQACEHNCVNG